MCLLQDEIAVLMTSRHNAWAPRQCDAGRGEDTSPQDAVWKFDTSTQTWQMRSTSGDVPNPNEACALAVQNGCAYLLTAEEVNDKGLIIYELDLETWRWRRLPAAPMPFLMDRSEGFEDEVHTLATGILKVCLYT